jgi:hypothetical protein
VKMLGCFCMCVPVYYVFSSIKQCMQNKGNTAHLIYIMLEKAGNTIKTGSRYDNRQLDLMDRHWNTK